MIKSASQISMSKFQVSTIAELESDPIIMRGIRRAEANQRIIEAFDPRNRAELRQTDIVFNINGRSFDRTHATKDFSEILRSFRNDNSFIDEFDADHKLARYETIKTVLDIYLDLNRECRLLWKKGDYYYLIDKDRAIRRIIDNFRRLRPQLGH